MEKNVFSKRVLYGVYLNLKSCIYSYLLLHGSFPIMRTKALLTKIFVE